VKPGPPIFDKQKEAERLKGGLAAEGEDQEATMTIRRSSKKTQKCNSVVLLRSVSEGWRECKHRQRMQTPAIDANLTS
jgi:hypothetical protein